MGYCETVCQLCGVSFAIARLRHADEPEEAAWSFYGSDFVEDGELDRVYGVDSGCTVLDGEDDRAGEHVAGPGCVCEAGYSGYRISLAEMKGCRAVQCLVEKGADWTPEDDDQGFETEGDYFLSGVGDGFPDESPLENMEPEHDGQWGLPFHPTCFEIYKRVCEIRMGGIDVEGLFQWRRLDGDYETFFEKFPRDPAVKRGNEQWWRHEIGCEYLVANPIDIPGLAQLLKPSLTDVDKRTTFGPNKGPDDSQTEDHHIPPSTSNAVQDPFSALSAEITSMIVDHLGSKDIANLRLATPIFRQLPTILFRRLFLEDMPWLFEAKDLDVARIDWYEWYCTWKFRQPDLKGLQNRRRIWRDVEEIVSRIQRYREEGKIGNS